MHVNGLINGDSADLAGMLIEAISRRAWAHRIIAIKLAGAD